MYRRHIAGIIMGGRRLRTRKRSRLVERRMTATISQFPRVRPALSGAEVARRYVRRAEEAFEMLARATTDVERSTLCDIAEIWLDMAEAALPAPR